jgi:hypothetical protein
MSAATGTRSPTAALAGMPVGVRGRTSSMMIGGSTTYSLPLLAVVYPDVHGGWSFSLPTVVVASMAR